jgi:RNase P/RNase MRP subunit p30
VPITVSSGATDEMLMRGPYDYAALTTLFDLSMQSALKALSENPMVAVERNREKLSPSYVAPGIRVVGRKTG